MPKRPGPFRRWRTAITWPFGVALTSWDYMWRTTPMHRTERGAAFAESQSELLELPPGISSDEVAGYRNGHGPLFHRLYRTEIRDSDCSAEDLMGRITPNLNAAAPTTFARFQKVLGERGELTVGDEYVVRMPGPWDGPVRVIDVSERSFRLATLEGHLEAGQIEFRAADDPSGRVRFEIESWARSGDAFSNLLYHRLRMAKEVQAHMWISFLEGVVGLSGGRMTGGVEIDTRRLDDVSIENEELLGRPAVRRRLTQLQSRSLNFDLSATADASPVNGWQVTDLCQALPAEPPGLPVERGSWELARRLMRGYEFADPSIVRAYYDPGAPLEGRDMLLKLQALGLVSVYVGVRVGDVYEYTREVDGREARVWGWNYRTLEGHVEMGQMAWEVWKWLATGEVEFHVHSISRDARIPNLVIRLGYRIVRTHERQMFLESTRRRMRTFVEVALDEAAAAEPIRRAAEELTARSTSEVGAAHRQLARNAEPQDR
jgi:uncharacterized protein (UPF0548 family)